MEFEFLDFIMANMMQLIPALYAIGYVIKHSSLLNDEFIPVVVMVSGVILAVALDGPSAESVIQGLLVGGLTVAGNTAVKQVTKKGVK